MRARGQNVCGKVYRPASSLFAQTRNLVHLPLKLCRCIRGKHRTRRLRRQSQQQSDQATSESGGWDIVTSITNQISGAKVSDCSSITATRAKDITNERVQDRQPGSADCGGGAQLPNPHVLSSDQQGANPTIESANPKFLCAEDLRDIWS